MHITHFSNQLSKSQGQYEDSLLHLHNPKKTPITIREIFFFFFLLKYMWTCLHNWSCIYYLWQEEEKYLQAWSYLFTWNWNFREFKATWVQQRIVIKVRSVGYAMRWRWALTLLGLDLVGWCLRTHFSLKERLFNSNLWILTFLCLVFKQIILLTKLDPRRSITLNCVIELLWILRTCTFLIKGEHLKITIK